jgi:CMP-N-acetylneuraminic acid synthetase
VIRNRVGQETEASLKLKMSLLGRQLEEANDSELIKKVFVNDDEEDFIK